jgi:hypothetical protein
MDAAPDLTLGDVGEDALDLIDREQIAGVRVPWRI